MRLRKKMKIEQNAALVIQKYVRKMLEKKNEKREEQMYDYFAYFDSMKH